MKFLGKEKMFHFFSTNARIVAMSFYNDNKVISIIMISTIINQEQRKGKIKW